MLTMRFIRPGGQDGATGALCPPITFHTLTTGPSAHAHVGDITAMGLLVRPEAAACLLGQATGAIVNQVLPWAVVAGAPEAARLEDEVMRSRTDNARLQALTDSLRRTLRAVPRGRDQAYARLCVEVGCHGSRAADRLGLGRRQLERRCMAVLGVSPKQFQRLVRFRGALSMSMSMPERPCNTALPMAAVALEAGYYDQSHLARDARSLVGAPLGHVIGQARSDSPWWPLAARIGSFSLAASGVGRAASTGRPAGRTTAR